MANDEIKFKIKRRNLEVGLSLRGSEDTKGQLLIPFFLCFWWTGKLIGGECALQGRRTTYPTATWQKFTTGKSELKLV